MIIAAIATTAAKVRGKLVIASGDAAPVFEPTESTPDDVPEFVGFQRRRDGNGSALDRLPSPDRSR
jgi:hypothetical protein